MEVIVKNKPSLIKWLSADPVCISQHVQSAALLTGGEYSQLMSSSHPESQAVQLLDIICGKGDMICGKFLSLLKDDAVNEGVPELRHWINTLNISEQTHTAGQSGAGTTTHICASGGSCVFAPIITGSRFSSIHMNVVSTSGRSDSAKNYHKPQRDWGRAELGSSLIPDDCWGFLRKNFSSLVQNVKNINPVVDDMDLHPECAANVRAQITEQDKMRKLLLYVNCESLAKRLLKALVKHEGDLIRDLIMTFTASSC